MAVAGQPCSSFIFHFLRRVQFSKKLDKHMLAVSSSCGHLCLKADLEIDDLSLCLIALIVENNLYQNMWYINMCLSIRNF